MQYNLIDVSIALLCAILPHRPQKYEATLEVLSLTDRPGMPIFGLWSDLDKCY